ncbi:MULTISPECIES: hypothetical protein [Clostridium]|uniref:hypothetical protein n=1 Tax=Clostridium TaxID=1485 RepID=UPI00080A5B9C|nr:hypothetical protein [Clostridium beijerinckii]OCB00388.1 hypothetical protein BGS1_15720 [Clostridium beijerinckii]
MKILNFNNEQFQAEKIIKSDKDIIGKKFDGNEMFAFRGISDFTVFSITNVNGANCDFDKEEPSEIDRISALESALSVLMGV